MMKTCIKALAFLILMACVGAGFAVGTLVAAEVVAGMLPESGLSWLLASVVVIGIITFGAVLGGLLALAASRLAGWAAGR